MLFVFVHLVQVRGLLALESVEVLSCAVPFKIP